jgi:hypothetical protein
MHKLAHKKSGQLHGSLPFAREFRNAWGMAGAVKCLPCRWKFAPACFYAFLHNLRLYRVACLGNIRSRYQLCLFPEQANKSLINQSLEKSSQSYSQACPQKAWATLPCG